jgi:NADH-quinone oxidoreductase subunit J
VTEAFYVASALAIFSTFRAVTCRRTMHAILYFIVSLLSVAVIFFVLGAPFAGVLEIIIYAGAVIVLFVFAVMLMSREDAHRAVFHVRALAGPAILSGILFLDLLYAAGAESAARFAIEEVGPSEVGASLFGPYLLGVELSGLLLLVGVLGAYHLGRKRDERSDEHA